MRPEPLTPDQRALARDLVEERAAIIEEGEGCTRWLAEDLAARGHGFADWFDFIRKTRDPNAPRPNRNARR